MSPRARGAAPRALDERAARLVAADLLSRRAWTRATLAARLRRRGASAAVADDVVADLIARGYLDDALFARHWIATRSARGYGRARLAAELRARGIAPDLVQATLGGEAPDADLERARAVARRRLPALRSARADRAPGRLRDHLLRRGFAGGLVARVVRELLGAGDED